MLKFCIYSNGTPYQTQTSEILTFKCLNLLIIDVFLLFGGDYKRMNHEQNPGGLAPSEDRSEVT